MNLRGYRRVTQGRKRSLSHFMTEMLQDPAVRAEYEALEWRGNRLVRAAMPKEPGLPPGDPMTRIRLWIGETWDEQHARLLDTMRRAEAGEITEDYDNDFGFVSCDGAPGGT